MTCRSTKGTFSGAVAAWALRAATPIARIRPNVHSRQVLGATRLSKKSANVGSPSTTLGNGMRVKGTRNLAGSGTACGRAAAPASRLYLDYIMLRRRAAQYYRENEGEPEACGSACEDEILPLVRRILQLDLPIDEFHGYCAGCFPAQNRPPAFQFGQAAGGSVCVRNH